MIFQPAASRIAKRSRSRIDSRGSVPLISPAAAVIQGDTRCDGRSLSARLWPQWRWGAPRAPTSAPSISTDAPPAALRPRIDDPPAAKGGACVQDHALPVRGRSRSSKRAQSRSCARSTDGADRLHERVAVAARSGGRRPGRGLSLRLFRGRHRHPALRRGASRIRCGPVFPFRPVAPRPPQLHRRPFGRRSLFRQILAAFAAPADVACEGVYKLRDVWRGWNWPIPGAPTMRPSSTTSAPRSSVLIGQPVTSMPS